MTARDSLLLTLPPGEGRGEGRATRTKLHPFKQDALPKASMPLCRLPHPNPLPEEEEA